jgi:carotenoid cleavage dioxygenase-like enzyme
MNAPVKLNPYLTGNFGPVRSEDDFADLPVTGEMPRALSGMLYRNGPNPQFEPRDGNHHWFAGDGMLHAFHIEGGKVSYRNRYVRTPKWDVEHEAGQSMFGAFGNPLTTDPSVMGKDSGVANTNILFHAGRLLALEEGHQPFEVDPKTLGPRGYLNYAGDAHRFTAHPKIDPETGEMMFFGYMAGEELLSANMAYGVVDKAGKVTRLDRFVAPFASMVHDFMVTSGHVLFPILPATLNLERAMMGRSPIAWEPEAGAFVGVVARNAGIETMRWFKTEPNYVFHVMNAWEEGTKIFADVMEYPVAPLFPNADGSRGASTFAVLKRWTFDLAGNTDTIKRELLNDVAGEFPRVDDRRAGLSYRHGWIAAQSAPHDFDGAFDTVAHVDHKTARKQVHTFVPGDVTGEPVFVPRDANAAEGDGFVLAVVYRGNDNRSDLTVFDAQDVAKGPIATAALPRRVPFGFHGNWLDASQL